MVIFDNQLSTTRLRKIVLKETLLSFRHFRFDSFRLSKQGFLIFKHFVWRALTTWSIVFILRVRIGDIIRFRLGLLRLDVIIVNVFVHYFISVLHHPLEVFHHFKRIVFDRNTLFLHVYYI